MIYLVIIYIIKSNKFLKIPLIFHKLKAHVNYSHFRFSIPYVWNKNWCDKQDVRKACNSKSCLPASIDSWRLLTKASFLWVNLLVPIRFFFFLTYLSRASFDLWENMAQHGTTTSKGIKQEVFSIIFLSMCNYCFFVIFQNYTCESTI